MILHSKQLLIILVVLVVALIAWTLWSWLVVKDLEEPAYTVIENKDGYEIRAYESHILAQTTVTGTYNEAMNQGFRIIASYIFGGNTKNESIAMTAPVSENTMSKESVSESIAMTVPVSEVTNLEQNNEHLISFMMPAKYTLETLPTPDDKRVKLVEKPERIAAVLTFGGYGSEKTFASKKELLLTKLKAGGIEAIGPAEVARFNPPFSSPFLLRNEIIIPIK